ncbi:MAG: PAS domain-containing protein [Arcobacteraceae bacterium]|jgi:aerotaxis receptor|nr:PAS domain-containing protein [Arcobacteraceae bacterium]
MSREIILDDYAFIVSETDEKGLIRFANDDFCKIAGYDIEELINKNHNIVRHPDMPKAAFKDLWSTLKAGNVWSGFVKNKCKNGDYYWVYATVYPFENSHGLKGYLSCRRKANIEDIKEHEILYRQLKTLE